MVDRGLCIGAMCGVWQLGGAGCASGGSDHQALLVTLWVHCPVVAAVAAGPSAWAAVVHLALAEALAFWSIDWVPVVVAVNAVLAEAPLSRAQGERALAVFEEGGVAQLAHV